MAGVRSPIHARRGEHGPVLRAIRSRGCCCCYSASSLPLHDAAALEHPEARARLPVRGPGTSSGWMKRIWRYQQPRTVAASNCYTSLLHAVDACLAGTERCCCCLHGRIFDSGRNERMTTQEHDAAAKIAEPGSGGRPTVASRSLSSTEPHPHLRLLPK